jgi:hypothetical protein
VLLPGERELSLLRRRRSEGVQVAAADLEKLRELAGAAPPA